MIFLVVGSLPRAQPPSCNAFTHCSGRWSNAPWWTLDRAETEDITCSSQGFPSLTKAFSWHLIANHGLLDWCQSICSSPHWLWTIPFLEENCYVQGKTGTRMNMHMPWLTQINACSTSGQRENLLLSNKGFCSQVTSMVISRKSRISDASLVWVTDALHGC